MEKDSYLFGHAVRNIILIVENQNALAKVGKRGWRRNWFKG